MIDTEDEYLATREVVPWLGYMKWSENLSPSFHRDFMIGFAGLAGQTR
tara:strand:+ start:1470 stop:1613 length:144 start_codon:yes stop_codon:yes gene_type:complete